jgi:putative ABC transport system permease protein
MGAIWQNLRYAARILAKNSGFTLVAVLTLALGIGANTAIFSVVYSALLRPLPYDHPAQLVTLGEGRIQNKGNEAQSANTSNPDFQDWKKMTKSFQALAAYGFDAFTLAGNGEPKNVFATQITPNFFRMLGVKPALGRDFIDGEDVTDGPHVVLLTNGFWRSDFGGDPDVIGRTIRLDGKPVTIVGVLPANFEFAPTNSFPLWVPMHAAGDLVTRRSLRWLNVVARLASGVTMQQAQAEMDAVTAQLARAYPQFDGSVFVAMGTLRHKIVGKIEPLLFIMFGAVGFVLLIACANVANLMMTRSVSRRKEFAIRTALGATRSQLFAQLLTESLLLAFAGALAGSLAAQWGVSALLAAIPENLLQTLPNLRTATANGVVLAFLCGIALLAAILFGLAPGIAASRSAVGEALKDESRAGTSAGQARLRNGLVIAEIAISLVLLVGAGLMLQSLHGLLHQNPGFDTQNLLTFSVNLPDDSYPSEKEYPGNNPSAIRFNHEFSRKLASTPGIESVGMTTALPIGGTSGTIRFVVEGRPTATGQEDECDIITAAPSYFSALKIPLVQGRFFADTDQVDSTPVLIVNRAFVKKYFPNENPIGKRTRFTFNPKEPYRQIVGVIANVAQDDLAEPPPPVIYYPNDQGPSTYMTFILRTAGAPAAFIGTAASALHEMDPQLPLIQPKTMDEYTSEAPAVFLRRYPSYLIGSFATLAVILAMIGLYGLISFTVLQRTREIGIRMALGARPADVLGLILKQGIGATLVGIVAGIVAGIALTRTMASLLFGVKPTDGLTFACVSLMLMAVALIASYIPARRAMKTDPLAALRHE